MKPIKRLQMGKKGMTPEFINQVKGIFEKERVLKITILRSASRNKEEVKKMGDELVAMLGNKYKYRLIGYVLTLMRFRKSFAPSK